MAISRDRIFQITGQDEEKEEEKLQRGISAERALDLFVNPPQKPSQVAAEEQQTRQPEQPEKRNLWSRVTETAENLWAATKALPAQIKAGVANIPSAAVQGTSFKAVTLDGQIDTLENLKKFLEKDINSGTRTTATGLPSFLGGKPKQATPEEMDKMRKDLDGINSRLGRLYAAKDEQEKETGVLKTWREESVEAAKKAQEDRQKILEKYGTPDKWSGQWLANEVAYNVPQFVGSFGLGLVTGVVSKNPKVGLAIGFSGSFVQEAGGAYQEARSQGLSDSDAQKVAGSVGTVNAMIEQLPLGRMLSKSPAGKQVNKNVTARVTKYLIERVKDGTFESGTEMMQEIVGNAYAQEYDENRGLFDNVPEAGVIGGILGGGGGAVANVIGGDIEKGNFNVLDPDTVENAEKAVEEAVATPKDSRTELQQEIVDTLQTEIGVTSFRGQPVKTVEETFPYYETTRAKGFENSLKSDSSNFNIQVNEVNRVAGVWEGNIEPSFSVKVVGSEENILSYASTEGQRANQDAVVLFRAGEGVGTKNVFEGVSDVKMALNTLAENNIQGATVQGKNIVVYDSDGSLKSGIIAVGKVLNNEAISTQGTVRFLEKSEYANYAKPLARVGNNATSKLQAKEVKVVRPTKKQTLTSQINDHLGKRTVKFREVTPDTFNETVNRHSVLIPIEYIDKTTQAFKDAEADVKAGVKTKSRLPILIGEGRGGLDTVIDGNHRLAEAIARGETKIRAMVDEAVYRKLADVEEGALAEGRTIRQGGRYAGSRSELDQINKYIEERGVKFRESTDELIESPTNPRSITTKFLEHPDIKGKPVLAKTYIRNLSNSKGVGLKAYEYTSIQEVLDKDFADQDRIKAIDFREALLDRMMSLEIITSDTYANYGIDNIGMDYYSGTKEAPKTYILNSPFDHGMSGHFGSDFRDRRQGLFGHFRVFNRDGIPHIAEIQSDAFQKGVGNTALRKGVEEDIKDLERKIEQQQVLLNNYKGRFDKAKTDLENFKPADGLTYTDESGTTKYKLETAVLDSENWMKTYQKEMDRYKERLEERKVALTKVGEVTKEERVFQTYKNIWQERVVREAISLKANEGAEVMRFPTPRTVSVIEGFSGGEGDNILPYEVLSAADPERLEVGDTIDYGGEEMTVLKSDDYTIEVAPTDKVDTFNYDQYREEEIERKWDEINSELDTVEEVVGTIDTYGKIQEVLDINRIALELRNFHQKDNDIKEQENGIELNPRIQDFEKRKESLAKYEKFIDLLKGGVIERENITLTNIRDYSFKDTLEERHGISHGYWNYILNAYKREETADFDRITNETLMEVVGIASTEREELVDAEKRATEAKEMYARNIAEIKSRKKPTEKELSKLPEALRAQVDENQKYFSFLDWGVEELLSGYMEEGGGTDASDSVDREGLRDFWENKYRDSIELDLEGIYGRDSVYYNEKNGNIDTVSVIRDMGRAESFSQPTEYEKSSTIEDFDIEDFGGEQRTVLDFYDKQVIPYIKKLRGENLKLIEDDNGYEWWETRLTDKDREPPTVYRIKDDFKQVGVTITDKQEQEIIEINKRFFGDISVKITEQILANNKAVGSYANRVIKILSGQVNPKDTFYHEAVHKYIDVFLTKDEQVALFMAGIRKYKTNDLAVVEERIAEDFIKYAKDREGVTGRIRTYFDKIISRVQKYLKNRDAIDEMYQQIVTPVKAKKTVKEGQKVAPVRKKITKTAQRKGVKVVAPVPAEPVNLMKPVGSGETKVSKLGLGVEARAVANDLVKQFADLPQYKEVHVDNQTNRAIKMIEEDYERAKRIALGQEDPPYGLLPESVFVAVENKALADGSIDLLRQLATSPRVSEETALGQRLRMLAERNKDSAVSKIRELSDARKKGLEKSGKTVKKETAKIKEMVDKQVKTIQKGDWKSFIDSIEC